MLDTENSSRIAVRHDARILIADDDALARLILADQLRALGCRCIHTAENGREALHLALHASYDLLITDLCMPVMDGPALLAELRTRGFAMPVVAGTAWGEPAGQSPSLAPEPGGTPFEPTLAEAGPLFGFAAVLRKPFALAQLRGLLNTHIGGSPLPQRANPAAESPRRVLYAAFAAAWDEDEPALLAALAALDADKMLARLHRLQGALAVLGEPQAGLACERLQQLIRRQGVQRCDGHIERFVGQCAEIASKPPRA